MRSVNARAARATAIGAVAMAILIFLPAGTLNYWQAWLFIAVFETASIVIGIYLAIHDAKLLERRMRVGPTAEKERSQRIIMSLATIGIIALIVVPALDHRFGWSSVPWYISVAGNIVIALGFLACFFVFRENSYSASTIEIAEGQRVISTGPYALVRHPMYAGAIVILIGVSPALGSWWGFVLLIFNVPLSVWRLLDEENFLLRNLPEYAAYTRQVRYRLVPYGW